MADNINKNGQDDGKRRSRLQVVAVLLILAVAIGAGLFLRLGSSPSHDHDADKSAVTAQVKYTCPMHPEIITDEPGQCPICGMDLVKIETETQPAAGSGPMKSAEDDFFSDLKEPGQRRLLFYRNPMNGEVTSPVPMKDEMGMDYVPVYEDEMQPSGKTGVPEGRVTIRVGPEALKSSGVQTAPAVRERISRTVRAVGLITADETRIRHVHTKVDGWVESLSVNFNGQLVTAGQPILSLYSPTLLTSQEEFLRARETAAKFSTNQDEGLRKLGQQLFDSARRRLELFDVPSSFINDLEREGKTSRIVTLNAPVAGFVTAKSIFEGQQIVPGQELFTITDLSRVWIEANLYEYEAGQVAVGQEAGLTLPYAPGVRLQGKVTYIYPFLNPESRTLKVRFEFANQDFLLKPAMYADVAIDLATVEGVVVADSAVMDTGTRKLAFVEIEAGTFEPREIETGVRGNGKVQIISGIRTGEMVAVKANFLLDSESRLRATTLRLIDKGHESHGDGEKK
ncbi:MAG: efflux RND transporter periplasmic adaptor subunit [Deltaproteobacteria bacterium]|nr:efflux RND transporter periplasmic adaptor subunit [Deltaproteobacteria bacterium]